MELGLSLGKMQEEHKAGGQKEGAAGGGRHLSLSMSLGLMMNSNTKSEIQENKDGEDDDDDDGDESETTYEDGKQDQNLLQLSLLPVCSSHNGGGGGGSWSWDNGVGGSGLELDLKKLQVAAVMEMEMEMEEGGIRKTRKKLRLSKQQSGILEESFKEHNTLNPKHKAALAKHLNLRPRQVEVWFQNRRARTKLKQTQLDCDYLNNCCQALTQENMRLHKELRDLWALKPTFSPFPLYATTLTICPSCSSSSSSSSSSAAATAAHPKPAFAFYPPS